MKKYKIFVQLSKAHFVKKNLQKSKILWIFFSTKFFLKILLFTPKIGTLDPDPNGLKKADPC